MKALLFGSIGTLCDTSRLQLESFNRAFAEHGLDWHWDEVAYRAMLSIAGGRNRMNHYARQVGDDPGEATIASIHARKSAIFQEQLTAGEASARPGVVRLIEAAAKAHVPVGLVTSTELANVEQIVAALGYGIDLERFAVVTHRANVKSVKPDPAPFRQALESLGVMADEAVAIEDTEICIQSSRAAGIVTLATPNEYSQDQDLSGARACVDHLGNPDQPAQRLAGAEVLDSGLVTLETLSALLAGT